MAHFVLYNKKSGKIRMKGRWSTPLNGISPKDILPNDQDLQNFDILVLSKEEFDRLDRLQDAMVNPSTKSIISSRIINNPPAPQCQISKLAIVTPHGSIMGTTIYALNLAEGLMASGLEVRIIFYSDSVDERLKSEAKNRCIKTLCVKRNDKESLKAEMQQVNAVIFHGSKTIGEAISEMPQRPKTIFVIHMESDLNISDYCSAIIDERVAVAQWLSEKCRDRCHVIYTGAQIKSERPKPIMGINDNVVLYIGRVSSGKNVDKLIESLRDLPPDTSIIIVGEGDNLKACQELANNPLYKSNVHFITNAGLNATSYLSMASVFVLPSSAEGNSVALLEALVAGVPIVTTRTGAAEEISDMGFHLRYTTLSPRSIAENIRKQLGTSSRRLAKRNAELAADLLDIHVMAKDYLSLLPELSTFSSSRFAAAYGDGFRRSTPLPLVSVIMPCYNYSQYMDEAIESVLSQTWKDFELILIDDKSTDDTIEKMHEWRDKDSRIVCIYHSQNRGLTATRNTGILASRGDLITYLDPDDAYMPDKLEQQVMAFAMDPGLDMVWGQCDVMGGRPFASFGLSGPPDKVRLREANYIPCQSVMLTSNLAVKLGGFDDDLRCMEDWDMWLRALHCGCNAQFIPHVAYNLRMHANQYGRRTEKLHNKESMDRIRNRAVRLEKASAYNKPIRILVVLPALETGGANVSTMELLRGIDKEYFEMFVCAVKGDKNGSSIKEIEDIGVPVTILCKPGEHRALDSGRTQEDIAKLIKVWSIDLVHNVNVLTACAAAREASVPIIHVRHQEGYSASIGENETSISVCRRGAANDNEALYKHVIYNGFDTTFWAEDEIARLNVRKEYDIPCDAKVALWVGRLSEEKGIPDLVDVTTRLSSAGVYTLLVPVGDQESIDTYLHDLKDLDHVFILNQMPREDLINIYSASDIIFLTSNTEGNPMVLIEGMLCGCAPVAFDVGGCSEIILDAHNGMLVPCGNTKQMANRIVSIPEDALQNLRLSARRTAEKMFNIDAMIERYERAYRMAMVIHHENISSNAS
jgi:glycosyltransferase involved in cell wall biosynthesis